MQDVLIIGGGAAGLATAIMAKTKNKNLKIAIIEQLDRVGKKLSVTGNGRCNITNLNLSNEHFHSSNIEPALPILQSFNFEKTKDFFSKIGVEFTNKENRVYPRSLQAASVVDALRFAASNNNIEIITSTKVISVKKTNENFLVKTENSVLNSKSVVIATGGLSGGSKLGSNGDGYGFLKCFGHKIIEQNPVIVHIKTENSITRTLKGIKINCEVTTVYNGTKKTDFGEVLFCDYGLSGPPVMQLSRYCKNGSLISLDLFCEYTENELCDLLSARKNILKNQPLTEFFTGILNKKLGQAVLKECGISLSNLAETLTEKDCILIAKKLKNFCFTVKGNTGFVNAQATSGGADLSQFFSETLMSKKVKGLFAVGEVLDLDGDCGGYNLQWAWNSANTVSSGLIKYLG